MKTVYMIPGYGERNSKASYRRIAGVFREYGWNVVPVAINWERKTMSDYVRQFLEQYQDENAEVCLFGFSFGAMIAYIASTEIHPEQEILCSLSPFFREDLPFLKKSWKRAMGKARMEDFTKYVCSDYAKKTTARVVLMAGRKEDQVLQQRVEDAYRKISGSSRIWIDGARHSLKQEEYFAAIKEVIGKI